MKKKQEKRTIKIRYSKEEVEVIKNKAKQLGLTLPEYQKQISKKAKVKIEFEPDNKD